MLVCLDVCNIAHTWRVMFISNIIIVIIIITSLTRKSAVWLYYYGASIMYYRLYTTILSLRAKQKGFLCDVWGRQ